MEDNQTTHVLERMLADHESSFGPDLWAGARDRPSKCAVDAIVFSLNTWDDRLQQWTHSNEFFTNGEFRNAVCKRLGCSYDSLSDDDLHDPDPGYFRAYVRIFAVMAILIALLKWCGDR